MDDLQIAREWARRFSAFDLDAAAELLAPGAVIHNVQANERIIGPEALVEAARPWSAAFDLRITLRSLQRISPGVVQALYDVSMRHVRPFHTRQGAVPPTGRQFDVELDHRYTIADGLITGVESYSDRRAIVEALGLAS